MTSVETVILGRTGLEVSIAGLGCGGHSRLGQGTGASEAQSVKLVEGALDLGINFIDTAAAYGTEEIVARGINGMPRDKIVISTKILIVQSGASVLGDDLINAQEFKRRTEASLKRLNTDYIDILHLHGVMPHQYAHCQKELVPALHELQRTGKIRFLGLTERFIYDTAHDMLVQALKDDIWDVVMAGFNLINPSARHKIFPQMIAQNLGTLCMFAVRRALSNPQALKALIAELISQDLISKANMDESDPLGFLEAQGGAESIIDGAYRFCRHEPGMNVVLTGTGNIDHLRQNIASIMRPALNQACLQKLEDLFGKIETVSGE